MSTARQFLGSPVVTARRGGSAEVIGTIETVTIDPKLMIVDGFLVGQAGAKASQRYLPRQCVVEADEHNIRVHARFMKKPTASRRILGLSAWTLHPRMLVGFVYDINFSFESGTIDTFIVHQLIRTWPIPSTAVEKITPRALLIDNDTTIKLKITPFPSETA